jgi:hypothetical protein
MSNQQYVVQWRGWSSHWFTIKNIHNSLEAANEALRLLQDQQPRLTARVSAVAA